MLFFENISTFYNRKHFRVTIIFLFILCCTSCKNKFNSKTWKSHPNLRCEMLIDLTTNYPFMIGKDSTSIVTLLGPPDMVLTKEPGYFSLDEKAKSKFIFRYFCPCQQMISEGSVLLIEFDSSDLVYHIFDYDD